MTQAVQVNVVVRRGQRWRRWGAVLGIIVLVMLLVGELWARYYLGLGDPPLSMADPQIEYLFKPNQDCWRFGNHIVYNRWSMRSEDFPAKKSSPEELRVLVIGDSVINGGNQTDQAQLATELLRHELAAELKRLVVVGNISTGSWGPANQLAYVKKHGLFDADVVVIVLNSGDAADVPTFEPIVGVSPDFPDRAPWLALQEGVTRYLPRYMPRLGGSKVAPRQPAAEPDEADPEKVKEAMAALRAMIALVHESGATVIVVQYPDRTELDGSRLPGFAIIAREVEAAGVRRIDLAGVFGQAVRSGRHPYRDKIHPNAEGQRLIAEALLGPVKQELERRP
ncbi:MAG: SGNH/GDSL hydrolase family protein [Phycisphaeraceae bacterium]